MLALKAFSAWATFPELSRALNGPLWGTCASSVHEAILGYEEFGGEVHAFAAAWSEPEIRELTGIVDHIIFNSLSQWRKFQPMIKAANNGKRRQNPIKCGLRLNPEHSEGAVAIYNPCSPGSRLGIREHALKQAQGDELMGISGLHFHTLCEQGSEELKRTLEAFEAKFGQYLPLCDWLNFGGGHHITKADYNRDLLIRLLKEWHSKYACQIYLEPGEAIALDAGWLLATVLDIVEADMPVAILDISAACHMPDVLEMPYRPEVWLLGKNSQEKAAEAGKKSWTCRLAGKSCLAGDMIGEYSFSHCLAAGDKLAFADMAIYSMVKTNTFNGIALPAIATWDPNKPKKLKILREFGYSDFKTRLS